MKGKSHLSRWLCLILVFLLVLLNPQEQLQADPADTANHADEDTRQVLQNSLSIVEIDHEIERITARQSKTEAARDQLISDLEQKHAQIEKQQERAGDIVRAYYMGDRDGLFMALLSASSLSNLLHIYDYYEMIIDHDHTILDTYRAQYAEIQKAEQRLKDSATELEKIKNNLIMQRERVLALQKEVDSSLQGSDNPEALKKLINEFTLYWENVGIYEVKRYFEALSSAMQDLPEMIQSNKGMIRTNGTTYSIEINEDDLNTFLRSKNELFSNFAFHFDDNKITASGKSGNLTLNIEGHYSIENEPQNAIMFHVDHLVFNGLELPDTTRQALEDEFDLGFYPQYIVSFVKATEVTSTNKTLHVTLKLSM